MSRQKPLANLAVRNIDSEPKWEKQPKESYTAFEQFRLYREMGPERAFTRVAAEVGIRYEHVCERARIWRWKERVDAWEKHLDKLRQQEFENEGRSMARRHARIGMLIQNKAEEAIGQLVFDNDNKPTASDVAKLAEMGTKIERAARGENTEETASVTIQLPMMPSWAKGSKVIIATPTDDALERASEEVIQERVRALTNGEAAQP